MQLLWWILVGLVTGWSAGKVMKGNGYGPLVGVAMGICGAYRVGRLYRLPGNYCYDSPCHDWRGPSDAARGFRERQTDVRLTALMVK